MLNSGKYLNTFFILTLYKIDIVDYVVQITNKQLFCSFRYLIYIHRIKINRENSNIFNFKSSRI